MEAEEAIIRLQKFAPGWKLGKQKLSLGVI